MVLHNPANSFGDDPNPDKPEIGNIKIENLKVKLRRLYNAMISQKNRLASHFSFFISHFSFLIFHFSFFISHFDIYSSLTKFFCHFCKNPKDQRSSFEESAKLILQLRN
jgi:hypothetical protein